MHILCSSFSLEITSWRLRAWNPEGGEIILEYELEPQNIKPKDIQRGPLGDHLKDDPASGDKRIFSVQKLSQDLFYQYILRQA